MSGFDRQTGTNIEQEKPDPQATTRRHGHAIGVLSKRLVLRTSLPHALLCCVAVLPDTHSSYGGKWACGIPSQLNDESGDLHSILQSPVDICRASKVHRFPGLSSDRRGPLSM